MKNMRISNNMIRRLPKYLRKLKELSAEGIYRISSAELGRQLGITSSQVRQDLSAFGDFGVQGYGYSVLLLIDQISEILGANNGFKGILVGAGNIGRALMGNFSFEECGIELLCAFDLEPTFISESIGGLPILQMSSLEKYLQETHIDIAVLCVPRPAAVDTARLLTRCGVEAIWNFTNVDLQEVETKYLVENVHFSDSLLALSYYLSERKTHK